MLTQNAIDLRFGVANPLSSPRTVLNPQPDATFAPGRAASCHEIHPPACNGLCETGERRVKGNAEEKCGRKDPKIAVDIFQRFLFAYREVPQASTGFSPFGMLYGPTVRGPLQILRELWTKEVPQETRSTYQYILDVRKQVGRGRGQLAREKPAGSQGGA